MLKQIYLTIYGGLGNQLYILAYAARLRAAGYRVVLHNEGQRQRADVASTDRARRDLFHELIEALGFTLVQEKGWEARLFQRWQHRMRLLLEPEGQHGRYHADFSAFETHTQGRVLPLVARVRGYFQSYLYLRPDFVRAVQHFLGTVARPEEVEARLNIGAQDVAIHLRRGDFLQVAQLYRIFGAAHYGAGLERLASEEAIGRVFVFSDDFEGIAGELDQLRAAGYTLELVEGLTPFQDLYLLTRFRRYVLANSTFSWWGAYCSCYGAQARVVVPERPLEVSTSQDSHYPEHWLRIDS